MELNRGLIILLALLLGACAPETQTVDQQIERYQQRLKIDPNNSELHYQLGRAHLILERYEEGASPLKDAVRLSKKHALAHRDLGWALYQLQDHDGAEPWLLKALEMKPRDRAALSTLSAVYISQKRYRDAIDLLKPFVDTGRGTIKIYNNMAVAYRHLGLYRLAIEQLRKALLENPDSADTRSNLGVLLEKTGKPEQALDEYRRALTLDPNHGSAHFNLAVALVRQEKTDEALLHFNIARQRYPNDPKILAGLGWAYQKLNRHREAILLYEQSVQRNPSNLLAQQALGELWDTTRQYDRAVGAYETATGLAPEQPDNYYHLGRLNDHLKQGKQAIAYMALAQGLYQKMHNEEMAGHCRKNVSILAAKYHLKSREVQRLIRTARPRVERSQSFIAPG